MPVVRAPDCGFLTGGLGDEHPASLHGLRREICLPEWCLSDETKSVSPPGSDAGSAGHAAGSRAVRRGGDQHRSGQGGCPAPRWEAQLPPLGRQGKPRPPGTVGLARRDSFTFLLRPSPLPPTGLKQQSHPLATRGPGRVRGAPESPLWGQQRLPTSLWLRPPASLV